jgi:RNA polymerase sigma-70 factor (ECF subfamily)
LKTLQSEVDDRLLVEAAQKNPSRFTELYEYNFDRVYAFVARRVVNREDAEDLTAEVFHQALVSIGRFEWRGVPFVAWLIGIAAKLIAQRWQRAENAIQVTTDELENIGMENDTERRTMLVQLVDALPPDQREVIVGRFINQKSIRDIAQQLERTEGAVKQLQFRALQTLRMRVRSARD